jgi:mannose-6-phosphate isomerase-like protein (cupin superfamily)
MDRFAILSLPTFRDERGALTVLQDRLPFPIRRVFWIYGADGLTRGGHRHHKTRQALIAVAGTVTVHMDDGQFRDDIVLDSADRCLLVEPKDWHRMSFGPSSVLLAVASHSYDRADYIETPYPGGRTDA